MGPPYGLKFGPSQGRTKRRLFYTLFQDFGQGLKKFNGNFTFEAVPKLQFLEQPPWI
jgi:hypothetical protein